MCTAPQAPSRLGRHAFLIALAAVLTGLNCAKPLTVDDAVYVHFATWISEHPTDPYGFKIWGALDANSVLAPPAFLYWWAAGVAAFGNDPVAWKVWLFPLCLLLVYALHALARRFAPGCPRAVVALVTLSPAFLPCVNLMLDVPAWALALAATSMFLRACDRESWWLAIGAGVVAGVACQTKYTAASAPAAMIAFGLLSGNVRRAVLATAAAGALFVGWEAFVAARYGDSHFLLGALHSRTPPAPKLSLVQPLFGTLGSAWSVGLLLAVAALGRSAHTLRLAVALILGAFAVVIATPESVTLGVQESLGVRLPSLAAVVFGFLGIVTVGLSALACRRAWHGTAADRFLVLWLVIEVGSYFALSPYPATRRIMGLVVVGTLLLCRHAESAGRGRLLTYAVVLNALLGALLFVVDDNRYRGEREGENGRTWMVANGAFEFYGHRAGIEQLLQPGMEPKRGDRVLVIREFEGIFRQLPISARCVVISVAERSPDLPVQSHLQHGGFAISRRDTPFTQVTVYRVR
jgi:Dolichyl-phosphate-mannose-protein mannosyltransferase